MPRPSPAGPDTVKPAASAARSLLEVLSQYVAPNTDGVWQETLLRAMGILGHSPAAVRQAISRSAREGALTTTRHGNRAYVELRDEARETLLLGERQAWALTDRAADEAWDGEWDVFVVQSRGKDQAARYQFRTSMLLSGLGYLGNSVWISPGTPLKDTITRALSAEPGVSVTVLRSRIEHPEASAVAERAWDLAAVLARYEDLLARFADRTAKGPEESFTAWTELALSWRECAMNEPGLPDEVLPSSRPRERAVDLVVERGRSWRPAAQAFFRSLTEAAERQGEKQSM